MLDLGPWITGAPTNWGNFYIPLENSCTPSLSSGLLGPRKSGAPAKWCLYLEFQQHFASLNWGPEKIYFTHNCTDIENYITEYFSVAA